MTRNDSFNDDVVFDRLVDGELTPSERRQLLETLDKRPEGWRRCALAFLEAQSWREELGQVARGSLAETKELKSPASSVARGAKTNWMVGAKWFAIAAGLLMAFVLGSMHRERAIQVPGSAPDVSKQVASVTPKDATPSPNSVKPNDELTFYVRDKNGRKQAVQVPLVDADELDSQLGTEFQSGVPSDVRNQLKQRGYTVQSKRKYAPLWMENDRPMVIPVEDTQIVPASETVWQ
jgi:hypothetical protein